MALFVDDGDRSGGVAVLLGVALRAVGGVWMPLGSGGVFWRSYGRVLKSAAVMRRCGYYLPAACCLLPAACCLLLPDL